MYFSIFILLIPLGYFLWKKYSWKTYIGFLESGDATEESFRPQEKSKSKYFLYPGGRIDLSKHPELKRFHVSSGKDVLVELWERDKNLYLEEGKSKVAIFEVIETKNGSLIAVLCLRKLETIINDSSENSWEDYTTTNLGVSWNDNSRHKIIPSENLIGVVKYESI